MHGIILLAGSIIASSIGFALAGFILTEAIRNSRRQATSRRVYRPRLNTNGFTHHPALAVPVCRGYDTPELYREDFLARTRQSGNDRDFQ
jgi:hypothetical protein